jgi:myo-inositol-1(or 4)-monophosphatase
MEYREFLKKALNEAADIALEYFGKVTTTLKADKSVLTEADLALGKYLVASVQTVYPDYNVIDEEAGVIDNKSVFTWVIDPIEATANFACGIPDWGIMMGLLKDAKPIAGGIVAPAYDKLYLAQKGVGATCNGKKIQVTKEDNLANTLLSFSLGGHHDDEAKTTKECRVLAKALMKARNMRNADCEATDTMYVAAGNFGGRINLTSAIWDNVAPQIICEEAGAIWTGLDGSPINYTEPLTKMEHKYSFCVASPALHTQLLEIISSAN